MKDITEEDVAVAMREYLYTQKVHSTKYALPNFLYNGAVQFEAVFDPAMAAMVLRLYTMTYGRKSDHVVVVKQPADWWEAFRERWFPKVWLKAYPVRYHETRVCAEEFMPYVPPSRDTHIIRRVYVEGEK